MKRIVLLFGIAAFFLLIAMISPAAALGNVSGIYDADANNVVPGETYVAYNFTYTDSNNPYGTNLTWFNITNWNTTATGWTGTWGNVTFADVANITLWNATTPANPVYIGHNNSTWAISDFNITVNLSNYWVPNGNKANITVNITLNTTGLVDGEQIAFNASLEYIWNATGDAEYTGTIAEWANDTAAETIEVLNATAGPSAGSAWEGNTNVLCANVTIYPGNTSVDNYLKKITFNTTAATTINPTLHIASFGLWNDTNGNKQFSSTDDTRINSSSPTEGANVTFDLSAQPLSDRTILAGTGANETFFLTMDIKTPAPKPLYTVIYQAQISNQSITINMSGSIAGNTGNSSVTTFGSLTVKLIARVPEFNTTGLIAFIGILSVVLAVVTLRRKR